MILVLIGLPGSGKGTQAELISNNLGFKKISVGDLLRKAAEKDEEIRKLLSSGSLLPGTIADEIVDKAISSNGPNTILDGYPRSMNQALFLSKRRPNIHAVYLDIDEKIVLERIMHRYMCTGCGAIYSTLKDQKIGKVCEVCAGENFTTREDDNLEAFKKRISEYRSNTLDVIEYFSDKKALSIFDANQEPNSIFEQIKALILSKQAES